MTLRIEFVNEQRDELTMEQLELLKRLLRKAAESEGVTNKEVAVSFVDNERIRRLNKQFRQIDKPTDVLSFPLGEEDMLGDIIISIPKAKEQARAYNHSFERELGFLTVHGFLHLLGYDHQSTAEEKEMFERQERILEQVGLTR